MERRHGRSAGRWSLLAALSFTGAATACGPGGEEGPDGGTASAGEEAPARDAAAYDELGAGYAATGEHEAALAALDSALALDPDYASALSNRGIVHLQLARWDAALADFDRVVELRPDEAKSWYDRAYALDAVGEYERALVDLDRAIELDPEYADAWQNRGIVRARRGELDLAIADFTRAIELDSATAAFKDRGIALAQAGRHRDAVADFSVVLRREPGQARHYLRRGRAYRALGDVAAAEADFRELLQRTGNPEIRKQAIEELREIGAL